MSTRPPWDDFADDSGGGGNPWDDFQDDVEPKKKDAFSALRGSKIEAQPSLLSRIGSQVKGFAQELPMTGVRGFRLLEDIASGNAAMNTKLSPADQAKQILASEKRYNERKRIDEMLNAAKPGEEEQRLGRIGARMVPGAIAAVGTGGGSLAGQAVIQWGLQAAQTLSEGASPETAAYSGLLGAAGPGAGEFVNSGITRFVKQPFKKSVDQSVVRAAQRAGVELPASAITNSSRARGLEQMASRMMGGAPLEERGLKALDSISEKAAGMGAEANPMLAGRRTAADYGSERASLQGIKNAEYEKVGNLTGIPANPEQTLGELDRLIQQGTLDPDTLANLKKLRKAILPPEQEGPDVSGPALQLLAGASKDNRPAMLQAMREAGFDPEAALAAGKPRSVADLMSQQAGIEYGEPNALRDAGLGNRLRESLGRDINGTLEGAAPDQAAQLAKAKEAYGRYADLSQSELGETVSDFGPGKQFDQIPKALLRPNASATDIQRLMDVVGPETQDQLRLTVLKQIVGNAEKVTPKQIQKGLDAWGKKAAIVLKPEQIQQLRDLSTISKAMAKTSVGSPTAPLLQSRKYLEMPTKALLRALSAGGVGAAVFGPAGLGVSAAEMAGETATSRFLGSAKGQKWLTTGLPAATRPGKAVRATGLAGSRFLAENDRAKRQQELEAILAGR